MNEIGQLWQHLTFIECSSVHRAHSHPSDTALVLSFIISHWDYYISILSGLLCLVPWRLTDRIWWSLWTISQKTVLMHIHRKLTLEFQDFFPLLCIPDSIPAFLLQSYMLLPGWPMKPSVILNCFQIISESRSICELIICLCLPIIYYTSWHTPSSPGPLTHWPSKIIYEHLCLE